MAANTAGMWAFHDSHAIIGVKGAKMGSVLESHVAANGGPAVVELHKVDCEVESAGCNDSNFVPLKVNGVSVGTNSRGHNLVVVDETAGNVLDTKNFDTWSNAGAADAMAAYINALPTGRIVLVVIKDEGSYSMTEAAFQALESLGSTYSGGRTSRFVCHEWHKGASKGSVQEHYSARFAGPVSAMLYKFNCQVVSAGHDDGNYTELKISGMDYSPDGDGYNIVVVNETNGSFIDAESFDTFPYGMELNTAGTETDIKFRV